MLDVACGTGNLAIPAARAGARVTGIDIAPNLIAAGAARGAGAPACAIAFEVGDAESLPYVDGQFDTTVTMFGAMFAYRPARAAAELLRVTRPGGRVAMANWTPEGFIGQMLRAHAAIVPPPPGVPSPLEWGKEDVVRARFGDGVTLAHLHPADAGASLPVSARGRDGAVRDLLRAHGHDAPGDRSRRVRAGSATSSPGCSSEHNLATDGTTDGGGRVSRRPGASRLTDTKLDDSTHHRR